MGCPTFKSLLSVSLHIGVVYFDLAWGWLLSVANLFS